VPRPGPALDRLLGRGAIDRLLAELESAVPGVDARVVVRGGRVVGKSEAHHAEGGPVREHAIAAGGENLGTLVVAADRDGPAARLTAAALGLAAEQALNVRFLAAETLERYRELNVLYEVGERIAGSLDPDKIVEAALGECRRVAASNVAAALLEGGDRPGSVVGSGEPGVVEALVAAAAPIAGRVAAAGAADVVADDPPLEAAGFGSVLAVPIRTERSAAGVLVLGRGVGRPAFTAGDEKVVGAVAAQLAIALQNAELHEREVDRRRMEDELAVGRQIQLGLLPLDAPQPDGWEIDSVYRPARQVGGDFFDYVETGTDADGGEVLGLVIGDVAGKGVPAALMMAYTRAVLRSEALGGGAPAAVLEHANETMLGECRRSALLVTAFLGMLDTRTGRLRYASAGHDWPIRLAADGSAALLGSSGVMLGLLDRGEFEDRTAALEPGDALILYTDGVTEARSSAGQLFGEERLLDTVRSAGGLPAGELLRAVVDAVDAFAAGAQPADDLTLVVVRRRPLPGQGA
jgi:serine phosphatase RsbU (regulator of sigma subunit)